MPYQRLRDIRATNNWYSQREAAAKLNVGLSTMKRLGHLYPPSQVCGACACYTAEDLAKIEAHLSAATNPRMSRRDRIQAAGYLSVRAAAAATGVPLATWEKGMERGGIPRPTHRIGCHRYYTADEARGCAVYFERSRRPADVHSIDEVASLLGVSRTTIKKHSNQHDIGQTPTPRRRWFTDADVETLRRHIYPVQASMVDHLDEYIRHLQGQFSQQLQAYAASQFERMQAQVEARLAELAKRKK